MVNGISFTAGDLSTLFDRESLCPVGETLEQIRHNYFTTLNMNGSDDASMGGLNIDRSGRRDGAIQSKDKKDRDFYDMILTSTLEKMRSELADLETQMEKRFEALRGKYGDDVIGGMAATFLSEAEQSGLDTEEQKMQALAEKFLDENGNVKEEYAHLEEALYVRDWNKAEELKVDIAQYEGRNTLSATEYAKEKDAAETASLSDNASKIRHSTNKQLQETVESVVDENRTESMVSTAANTSLDFGKM